MSNNVYSNHDVYNQPSDLADVNLFETDLPLQAACKAFGADWAIDHLNRTGAVTGSAHVQRLAWEANRHTPELRTHDRTGHRIDEIHFHPAWHHLMTLAYEGELHSLAWTEKKAGAHVARAALSYLWNQAENGICCPAGMTFASVATLRHAPVLAEIWQPQILRPAYDERPLPAEQKTGLTVGMAMTEKQGGSDLRQVQTTAKPAGKSRGPGSSWLLDGHKWFFSVPQSDLFLTLARTDKGVTCFLARGWLEDGQRNRLKLQRLKEKCGNRSNASSEVEFYGLEATIVGEEGRGIRTLLEMAHLTRLDCAISSAGLMRQTVSQAIHHCANRLAFQKRLIEQPVMGQVVADLALEAEAMMWMGLRAATSLDRSESDETEALLCRITIPMAKYWACKRAPMVAAEALECHGGNGFVEDHMMARLYREAPLNGVWEGSGNIICLDVARALHQKPECGEAFLAMLSGQRGKDSRQDSAIDQLAEDLPKLVKDETLVRHVVGKMAIAYQASLLLEHAPAEIAESFCNARLGTGWNGHFGGSDSPLPVNTIIDRMRVATGEGT